MKHPITALLLLTTLLLLSCKPKQVVDPPQPPQPPAANCGAELSRGTPSYNDPVAAMEGMPEGDCIQLKLSYSGGCKEHDFDLYWDGSWEKTKPPVAHLHLSHNANGDACEAIKSAKLGYNLKPLRDPNGGQVIVDIHAQGVPLVRVNYSYKQ
jgi:hypothetical protein